MEFHFALLPITIATNQAPPYPYCVEHSFKGLKQDGAHTWDEWEPQTGISCLSSILLFPLPWPTLLVHCELGLGSPHYFHGFHYQCHYQIRSSPKGPLSFSCKFVKLNITMPLSLKLPSPCPPSSPEWFPGQWLRVRKQVPTLHTLPLTFRVHSHGVHVVFRHRKG